MMHEDWQADRDSGDETDDDHEYDIDFDPAPELLAGLNDQAVCPKGHPCERRVSDGALWCSHTDCDCAYYQSIDGMIPRRDAA